MLGNGLCLRLGNRGGNLRLRFRCLALRLRGRNFRLGGRRCRLLRLWRHADGGLRWLSLCWSNISHWGCLRLDRHAAGRLHRLGLSRCATDRLIDRLHMCSFCRLWRCRWLGLHIAFSCRLFLRPFGCLGSCRTLFSLALGLNILCCDDDRLRFLDLLFLWLQGRPIKRHAAELGSLVRNRPCQRFLLHNRHRLLRHCCPSRARGQGNAYHCRKHRIACLFLHIHSLKSLQPFL